MKLIIDIDDELYSEIKNKGQGKWHFREMDNAIRQGMILPKEHGRLIDVNNLCIAIAARMFNIEATNSISIKDLQDVIDNALTIIEADKDGKIMTFEEAKNIFLNRGYIEVPGGTYYDADKWRNAIVVISKWLEQQPCEDAVSRKDVHDMLENLPVTVENKWFNWLQKACIRLAELPSVTPKEKSDHDHDIMKDYVDGEAFILDMLRKEIDLIQINREEGSQRQNDYCDGCEFIIKQILEIIDKYEEGFVLPFARSEEDKEE